MQHGCGPAIPSSSSSELLGEVRRTEDGSRSLGTIKQKFIIPVQSRILSIAFLADGRHFVGGGKDGMIRQYRMEDGKEVGEPLDVESPVLSIAASRDGKWIVAGTENGRVITWDPKNHEEATEFPASDKGINAIDISPDGTKIATASDDENADVWSLASGEWLWGWEGGDFDVVKFSPDGRLFVTNYNDVGKNPSFGLQIVDSQDVDKLLWKMPVSAKSAVWASDSKQLFVLSASGSIRCLDVYSQTTSFWVHDTNNPTCIPLSSNGKFFAAAVNSSVSFWETSTHRRVGSFIHRLGPVRCMAMSQNYELVVVDDLSVTLWGLRDVLGAPYIDDRPKTESHPKATILEHHVQRAMDQHAAKGFHKTTEIREHPVVKNTNSRYLEKTGAGEGNSSTATQWKPIEAAIQNVISSVAFLADGQHFVGCGKDGRIRCWRLENEQVVEVRIEVSDGVSSIAVSQDGKWIAAGLQSGTVVIWDAKSRKKANVFIAQRDPILSLDVSPDGKEFVTSDAKTARIFSTLSGGQVRQLFHWQECNVHTVKFSPNGKLIAIAKSTPSLRICHTWVGGFLGSIQIFTQSFAWTKDSKTLLVLSYNGHIYHFDAFSQAMLSKWRIISDVTPTCISLSSDGSLIIANTDSSISFWDASTHQQICPVIPHLSSADCMAVSTNYGLVVARGRSVAIWDLHIVLSTPHPHDKPKTCTSTETHLNDSIVKHYIELAIAKRAIKQKRITGESTNESLRAGQDPNGTIPLGAEDTESHPVVHAYQQKLHCEILYADGLVIDAARSFLNATESLCDNVKVDTLFMSWLSAFTNKCITKLERIGDDASEAKKDDEALAAYAVVLSLSPLNPHILLTKWAAIKLRHVSIKKTLDDAKEFKVSRIVVFRAICDALEKDGLVPHAIGCFQQMKNEPAQERSDGNEEQLQWEPDFRRRCTEKLEKLADIAIGSQRYIEGDWLLSTMLSLDPLNRVDILIKRSKTRVIAKSWEDALSDADEVVRLEPDSHLGYEQRHIALHGAKRYAEAVAAFDALLLKLQESSDIRVHALRLQYTDARTSIRAIIDSINAEMPPVLIDIATGQLFGPTQRAKAFETLPIFNELVSSMTREVDETRISREVKEFLRYVMFSHRWGDEEPNFKLVLHDTVYELEPLPGNIKLQKFCSLVRFLGIRWAWSDTCCIDRTDNVVLQRSLVAMFQWYRHSFLTIIHLLGVSSLSEEPDDLQESIWNSRVWTYQEYVAAERVLFYTEDWKPYRGLTLSNHKESPIILRQMEVSPFSAEQVAILRPGLDNARVKLYLASTRETTLVEDIAYSLLGILDAPIPVIYGEGTRAVGRLLEYVLAGSSDVTILAWTGTANKYNSCLPLNLAVYCPLVPPHIPHMETLELGQKVAELRSSLPDASLATTLYERLNGLPSVSMASSRLRLPCIVFHFTFEIVQFDARANQYEYHVTTALLENVKIVTSSDLDMAGEYCLVHPWIYPLLDQEYARGHSELDKTTQALRLVVRLRQRFGALLFQKMSRVGYMRVAADSLIMVQIRETVSLTDLVDNIDVIEVQ